MLEAAVEAAPGDDYEFVVDGRRLPDPGSRWQPARPARALAAARHAARSRGPTTTSGPRPARPRHLRAARRHVHRPRARSRRDRAPARRSRELGVTTIELMPVAEFPGRHGWGYDGVYLSAAQSSYGGPEGLQRLVDAAHGDGPRRAARRRLQPRRRLRERRALSAFGPYFTRKHETPWGARDQRRRRATATPSASGSARAPRGGSATSTSTGCASTRSTRSSTPAPSTSWPRSAAACTRSTPGRARDRRVRPERPEGHA